MLSDAKIPVTLEPVFLCWGGLGLTQILPVAWGFLRSRGCIAAANNPVPKSAFQRPDQAFFGTGMFREVRSREIRAGFAHAQRPHVFSIHGRDPAR